jgi:hypothetical protein
MEMYCKSVQAADDSMAQALCVLDNYVYKHTPGICNTYRFSTSTVIARTRLIVTLYVQSCLLEQ